MSILEVKDLRKSFGGVHALDGVSLKVEEGEILGIMGPNGSGKTTLFNAVTGALRADSGTVRFDGADITRAPSFRIARMGVARTFQNLRIFTNMTTTENILCGAHMRENTSVLGSILRTGKRTASEAAKRARAIDLLKEVGLTDRIDAYASDLSYGQTKRLELARALNTEPRILFLDEPTAGLNDAQAAVLLGLVRKVCQRRNLTLVVIEHNVPALVWLVRRIAVMDAGSVIVDGPPEVAVSDPKVVEAYLGHSSSLEVAR